MVFDQVIKLLLLQIISVKLLEHVLLDFRVTEQEALNFLVTQVNNFIHCSQTSNSNICLFESLSKISVQVGKLLSSATLVFSGLHKIVPVATM